MPSAANRKSFHSRDSRTSRSTQSAYETTLTVGTFVTRMHITRNYNALTGSNAKVGCIRVHNGKEISSLPSLLTTTFSYFICLYDAALWSYYNACTISKLAACYNRCIKTFFGFTRRDSVTQVLLILVCQVLILCCITVRLFYAYLVEQF